MAPISPVRAAGRLLPVVTVVALAFGGLLVLNGEPRAAVAATLVTLVALGAAFAQAPARLAYRLEEVAGQVPGEPEASMAWHGDQTLEWPDLGLTVEGNIHRYRLQDFAVHTGEDPRYVSASRPREAARLALAELDVEPSVETDRDRLPSLYPRLAGVKTGLVAAFLAAIAVGLGGPFVAQGVYALSWWLLVPAVGVLAGTVRWLGLAHTQQAYATLLEELRYGEGLEVASIDRTDGSLALDVVVHTPAGSVVTGCLALPWGSLTARPPDGSGEPVTARLPAASPVAARIGAWLR